MAASHDIYSHVYETLNDHIQAYRDETSIFARFDTVGAVGHARSADLEIGSALAKILQPNTEVVELEFYADRLSSSEIIEQPSGCCLMTFVGRLVFVDRPLKVKITEPLVVMLHCGNSSTSLAFAFELQHGSSVLILGFRIFLQDIQIPSASPTVNLRVVLGQEMQDLSVISPMDMQEHSTAQVSSRSLHFVTTESVFGFEYVADTKEVLMDGALSGEHGTSAMSPFRSWTVSVESDTELRSVDGLQVELRCDVTYV